MVGGSDKLVIDGGSERCAASVKGIRDDEPCSKTPLSTSLMSEVEDMMSDVRREVTRGASA